VAQVEKAHFKRFKPSALRREPIAKNGNFIRADLPRGCFVGVEFHFSKDRQRLAVIEETIKQLRKSTPSDTNEQ
jgi:hypothetical protein